MSTQPNLQLVVLGKSVLESEAGIYGMKSMSIAQVVTGQHIRQHITRRQYFNLLLLVDKASTRSAECVISYVAR